jgi:hypothetical protein
MTFTEWYKETKEEEWRSEFAESEEFVQEMEDDYFAYCHEFDLEPIWNG